MSTFVDSDHPRNHPTGASRFSDKINSEPEAALPSNGSLDAAASDEELHVERDRLRVIQGTEGVLDEDDASAERRIRQINDTFERRMARDQNPVAADIFTPAGQEVREEYQSFGDGLDFKRRFNERGQEFDRWLTAHDALITVAASDEELHVERDRLRVIQETGVFRTKTDNAAGRRIRQINNELERRI